MKKKLPWLVLALFAGSLILSLRQPAQPGPDARGFGRLPVLQGGRIKPLDTIARSSLLMIRDKSTLRVDGRRLSAIEWLLDVMSNPSKADGYEVFAINDPDLLAVLGRKAHEKKFFSFKELEPSLKEIEADASSASELEAPQRSRFQTAAVNLQERILLYQRLKNTVQLEGVPDFSKEIAGFEKIIPAGIKAVMSHQTSGAYDRGALQVLNEYFERYRFLSQSAYFRPLPPPDNEEPEQWVSIGEGLLRSLRQPPHPGTAAYAVLMRSYREADAQTFNGILGNYELWLERHAPKAAARARHEAFFNRLQPFYWGMVFYVGVLLLAFGSWLVWPKELERSAFFLLLLAFFVHTAGLIFRIYLEARPPVTNLYSSAVFVGWIAVLLGIILEKIYRKGFGAIAASAVGFSTLIIAHHLSASGDTMEMMRAVLDSNFWLGTHVVTVTMGYGGNFLAALLAQIYIFMGFLTPSLTKEKAKALTSMTYGVVCFSLFFSFLGTVLGGIWADQSWGRFWGWDPKENGALMIVLWDAIVLHARWGGYIRERGLMIMAVFGGIITSLSWFGVNMLGIGLHSYGFMDKAFFALAGFIAFEAGVMIMAGLPLRYWYSHNSSPRA